MFGYLRVALASIVMFSHMGITAEWGNLGASSVVIFYMISGYVVTNLWDRIFFKKKNPFTSFYIDRALRIFPLFYLCLLVYILYFSVILNFEIKSSWNTILLNAMLVPCTYPQFFDLSIGITPSGP